MGDRSRHHFFCLGIAACLVASAATAGAQVSTEYAIKAAYLTKFVAFIEWPESAFANSGAPITVCILGEDPFGADIDKAASNSSPSGRMLAIRRIAVADSAEIAKIAQCQIVYVGDPLIGLDTVPSLKDKPVVTVTDSGMRTRGVISFVTQDNHVRFDIDDAAAERNGIRISSKLLNLAHAVTRKGAP